MEIKEKNIDGITNFWNWFSENCQLFGNSFENAQLINKLDEEIVSLGNGQLSWEIGPGINEANALVISPNGNLDLLEYTKTIVAKAKQCNNWEYHFAKPPKHWDLAFEFQTQGDKTIKVDALDWKYILLQYEDGMYGTVICCSNLEKISKSDRLMVAEILLDGILGEEKRIKLIDDIEMVYTFTKAEESKAGNIKDIEKHLQ
jgi:hypothetical protein